MTKYREITRLTNLVFSRSDIMASCGVAPKKRLSKFRNALRKAFTAT